MSFGRAEDLLKLAEIAAARHIGVSLADIAELSSSPKTGQ
jgi:DNA-binding transcriptional MerR regulator